MHGNSKKTASKFKKREIYENFKVETFIVLLSSPTVRIGILKTILSSDVFRKFICRHLGFWDNSNKEVHTVGLAAENARRADVA